jgi:hypothetical protein
MAYLVVENFSGGLDGRRHVLASKPGTLARLRNGHVTRGGEVEKRKAFSTHATLPTGTFGLQVAGGKLWTFGSGASPTMPAGVDYHRLQHPDGLSMTALVSSTAYGGKTFAIAEYSDGSRFAFWGASIVSDFVDGVVRPSMVDIAGFASHLAGLFPRNGYTATATGTGIIITGPVGVEFTLDVATTGTLTATMTKTQTSVTPVLGVAAKGSFTVSQGSENPAKTAERNIRFLDVNALPDITGIYVNGVEILGLSPGSGIRYNSAPDTPGGWNNGPILCRTLAYFINQNTVNSNRSAHNYNIQQSGTDSGRIQIKGDPREGPDENGYEVFIEFASNPNVANGHDELIDTHTHSPYHAGRYIGKFGTFSGGTLNGIESVRVDGVEQVGSFVHWITSNSVTAASASDAVNTFASPVEYLASVSEARVVLTDNTNSGASANGRVISVGTIGNAIVSSVVNMNGGTNVTGGQSQKNSVAIAGTFTPGSTLSLVITETRDPINPIYIGSSRVGGTRPSFVTTFKSKIQLLAGSSLYSSAVDNPTQWGLGGIGTSVIDLSNNFDGAEELISCAPYQGKFAIFSRRNCQVWNIDVDPAQNSQLQIVQNTGCLSGLSATTYGDIDVFYLSDAGVRSLRARDGTNQAMVNDVGIQVDNFILDELRGLSADDLRKANATIDPVDGRYMLAIGTKVYVLSQFSASGISSWSTYEPGFAIEKMMVLSGRLYARSGNTVYLYGGADNNTYDSTEVELIFPYLDGGKPAHRKTLNGVDLTVEGTWALHIGTDPSAPEARDHVANVSAPTFSLGRVIAVGFGTHFGIRLTSSTNGYARLANLLVHYELNDAD